MSCVHLFWRMYSIKIAKISKVESIFHRHTTSFLKDPHKNPYQDTNLERYCKMAHCLEQD